MIHYAIYEENWGTRERKTILDYPIETERDKTTFVGEFFRRVTEKIASGEQVVNPSISRLGVVLRNKYGERYSTWVSAYEVSDLPGELEDESNEEEE